MSVRLSSPASRALPPPCVNMHEDLGVINSGGVHVVPLPFTISAQNAFNGLIMKRITSPTANYKFLEGERGEKALSLPGEVCVGLTSSPSRIRRARSGRGGEQADRSTGDRQNNASTCLFPYCRRHHILMKNSVPVSVPEDYLLSFVTVPIFNIRWKRVAGGGGCSFDLPPGPLFTEMRRDSVCNLTDNVTNNC